MTQQQELNLLEKFLNLIPQQILKQCVTDTFTNRDERRRYKKESLGFKIHLILNTMEYRVRLIQNLFSEYSRDSESEYNESDSYEEILDSINDENYIERILYMLYRCCDDDFDKLHFSNFIESENFQKYLTSQENTILKTEDTDKNETATITENIKTDERMTETMGNLKCYVGIIERKADHYNFLPQYTFSDYEMKKIFDPSGVFPDLGKLSLYHSYGDPGRFLQSLVPDKDSYNLYAVYFSEDEVEEYDYHNIKKKVDFQNLYVNGINIKERIVPLHDLKIYKVVTPKAELDTESFTNSYIEVCENYNEGDEVVLKTIIQDTIKYFGPYKLEVRAYDSTRIVKPNVEKSNYILPYYAEAYADEKSIEYGKTYFNVVTLNREVLESIDIIPDAILLSEFTPSWNNMKNSEDFVRKFSSSPYLGNIPDEFKKSRINRVETIFKTTNDYTNSMKEAVKAIIKDENIDLKALLGESVRTKEEYQELEAEKGILEVENQKLKSFEEENIRLMQENERLKENADSINIVNNEEVEELKKRNAELEKLSLKNQNLDELEKKISEQENTHEYLIKQIAEKEKALNDIRNEVEKVVKDINTAELVRKAIDPYISSALLGAVNETNSKVELDEYKSIATRMQELQCDPIDKDDLINKLVSGVQKFRKYDKNDILNIYICLSQSFLTIFSGEPGTGKTSICNIVAHTLGLNSFEKKDEKLRNRFAPVSVERGWSSKRDLIGYFNPLTKKYDRSNAKIYDSLMILNQEKEKSRFPYLILLDEANLSPMEYYWSDFMRATEDSEEAVTIDIGLPEEVFIPKTLHFLATINNDQTTEKLSPRLIDRAWIIKLPDVEVKSTEAQLKDVFNDIVLWDDIKEAFITSSGKMSLENVAKDIYDAFNYHNIPVSPRVKLSIEKYVCVAQEIMDDDNNRKRDVIALDYAVLQKLLPKINGYYNDYKTLFQKLSKIFTDNKLAMSAAAIAEMEERQKQNMGYCEYLN